MNTTTLVPYDWLKPLAPNLLELDEVPLFGNTPHFPWEQFSDLFAQNFKVENLKIEPGELKWRQPEDLVSGLGQSPHSIPIEISALAGFLYWVMAEKDITLLMSSLLTKNDDPTLHVIDHDLQEGFYQFIALESLHILSQVEFDKSLTPHILKEVPLPQETGLCLDIKITIYEHVLWGRLILTPAFRKSWKEHYAERKLATHLSQSLAQKIQVSVGLEAGRTSLSFEEWKQVSPGDFIILDHCSIEPDEEKGRVWITLNGKHLLRARLKAGNLKILESPLYHEVHTAMETNFPENDEHFEDEDDFSEDDELDLDHEEEEDEDVEEEDEEEEELEEDDEQEYSEETEIFGEKAKEKVLTKPEVASRPKAPITANEIPIDLVVEIGRLHISVQKLLDLQPGNLLELDVRPESGVDLVVNGKCVGKGELLKVGETLGVRVLDLG